LNYIYGMHTLDLTRYELGNVIWKECVLKSVISDEDARSKARHVIKVLRTMNIEEISSEEDFNEVMNLAIELKLTFYDASYLHIARKEGLTLVTEDRELRKKSSKVKVKAVPVSEYVKEYKPETLP
jgi:predicted nucleic acid-binding protein